MDITFSVFNSRYNPYNSPTAYVPHSAINLSVKPGEGSAGPTTITATDLPTENPAGPTSNVVASYLDNSQDFSSATNSATAAEVNRASVAPSGSVQANSSPQILDLTRGTGCTIPAIAATGSLIGALGGSGGTAVSSSASVVNSSFNVAPSSIVPIVSTKNASSVEASTVGSASSSSSKREQTEPMDYSSGQGMTFANRNFDTSTFNRGASPGDLSRFRSSSKSNPYLCNFSKRSRLNFDQVVCTF